MGYLIFQILFFLIAAIILGFVIGWFTRGSNPRAQSNQQSNQLNEVKSALAEKSRALIEAEAARDALLLERNAGNDQAESGQDAPAADQTALIDAETARDQALSDLDAAKKAQEMQSQALAEMETACNTAQAARDDHVRQLAVVQAEVAQAKSAADTAERRSADLQQELAAAQAACMDCTREVERLKAELAAAAERAPTPMPNPEAVAEITPLVGAVAPNTFAPRQGPADDLKLISGVGPKLEQRLNDLGVFQFHQIAAFTPENIAWVDEHLNFKGRIERDNWIGQAKTLAAGRTTDFSRRQD